jgi:L-ascorbate metabolism protein UlaG (beta-lactamase superfamily)
LDDGSHGRREEATADRSALRITWIGHSTVLIELDGVRLLTDPVFRRRFAHLRRVGAEGDAAALGTLDAVLLSHLHYDHLDLPSLLQLGRDQRLVVPAGAGRLLRKRGFERIDELARGEGLAIGGVEIEATHAEHSGQRFPFGADVPAVGYLVSGSTCVYFAGDTDLFDGMSTLAPPRLDVALLPVAGWGPRVPAGHLDPRRAAQALELLRPRTAVPIHWGTYLRVGLRQEGTRPPDEFVRHAQELAPEVDVVVLPVGGSFELTPLAAPAEDPTENGVRT